MDKWYLFGHKVCSLSFIWLPSNDHYHTRHECDRMNDSHFYALMTFERVDWMWGRQSEHRHSHIIAISIGYLCATLSVYIYLFTFCWIIKLNRCAVIMNGDHFDYWLLLVTVRSRKEENFHPNEVRWKWEEVHETIIIYTHFVHRIRSLIHSTRHWALKKKKNNTALQSSEVLWFGS